ncbi:hypothetical protein LCGC14_0513980 [marine sediment metagenome]|uniref:Uncharacterized protein n=1 Tax=marine sediment metagenome TaxID=412755 RepID=A0A0F9UM59_9ZZZZ
MTDQDNNGDSGFQIVHLSPADEEFSRALAYARYCQQKMARYATWLFMRMVGRW